MKRLQPHSFSPGACRQELDELAELLRSRPRLGERRHVLPFFRERLDLSMFLAEYIPVPASADVLAHEYPLSGDFTADLVIGDSARHLYLLVEFEDGAPDSLFISRGRKSTLEWSPRFEHAFSQIVDWLLKLEDLRSTGDFPDVFGSRTAQFHGLIVIGKDVALEPRERSRLAWQADRVVVDSHKVSCVTFDQLCEHLDFRLGKYRGT